MGTNLIFAILSPILLTIGGIISWLIKTKKEELHTQEEKAREEKLKTYEVLLEPYIIAFTFTISEKDKEKGINKIKTLEYRKAAFNLMTFGSDEVVRSFNKIMQGFYTAPSDMDKSELGFSHLKNFSELLLVIRKDLYAKNTKLKRSEMLEFMMNDLEKYRVKFDT